MVEGEVASLVCCVSSGNADTASAVQKFMASIYKKHDNKFGNKERYLHSLNSWLETMPEHCMDDVDNLWLAAGLGWGSVVLAAVSGYVSLTATVVSGKKDY
jgi:hypothetical protein